MKSPFVSELQPNQMITGQFLVAIKDIRQKKTGEPYLSLILADRTGELEAKMWDNATEVLDTFERDQYVRVKGLTQLHQGRLQLTVHRLVRMEPHEVDSADYFPCSAREPEEMFAELRGIVDAITNPHLTGLLTLLLDDPVIARQYRLAPAAKTIHHAYLGGLLEHVLSMCTLARAVAPHYRDVDLDLLLAGIIVHDIGKTRELVYDRAFGYSTEGQLLGHIVIGLGMVRDKLVLLPDFPERLRVLLEHLIVSHHGELAFGSPRVPLFPEALLLHHLDNLDSKMEAIRAHAARDRHGEGDFTGFCNSLERSLLHKGRYLDGPATVVLTECAPVAAAPVPRPMEPVMAMSGRPAEVRPRPASPFGEKLQGALRKEKP